MTEQERYRKLIKDLTDFEEAFHDYYVMDDEASAAEHGIWETKRVVEKHIEQLNAEISEDVAFVLENAKKKFRAAKSGDDEKKAIERMADGPAASPEGAATQAQVKRAKAGK
jgi:hypothetical protein